jgi:hypothetical protein
MMSKQNNKIITIKNKKTQPFDQYKVSMIS